MALRHSPSRTARLLFHLRADGLQREVLRGALAFAQAHKEWHVEVSAWNGHEDQPSLSGFDAALGVFPAKWTCAQDFPIVHTVTAHPTLPSVINDDEYAALLAADHFLAKGFREFVFVKSPDHGSTFFKHLSDQIKDAGFHVAETRGANADLVSRLLRMPFPVALVTENDLAAREIAVACNDAGIRIPEQVAILGHGNDPLVCESLNPGLSSVEVDGEQIGHRAAEMLHAALAQGTRPVSSAIPPTGVTARRSTDLLAVQDIHIRAALRFISENFRRPIGVGAISSAVPMSRRNLERRFAAAIGRSIASELRRVRVEQARRLLATPSLSVKQIAGACGFGTMRGFMDAFTRATGCTPAGFRIRTLRKNRQH